MRLRNLLNSIFRKQNADAEIQEIYVRDFMKPRSNVEFIKVTDDSQKIAEKFIQSNDMILPLIKDESYNIIGSIKVYNIFKNWHNAVQPIASIPENVPVNRLLTLLQKYDLIVVVDEYGNCSGIVTKRIFTESLLDKFILSDKTESDTIIVGGDVYLSEIGIDFSKYVEMKGDTVSSFVISLFNKMPENSEFIVVGPYKIEVLSCNNKYINKVCIRKIQHDRNIF